jgi:hypothetical protein
METDPHARSIVASVELLSHAVETAADTEKVETFSRIVDTLLENVGSRVRFVMTPPEGTKEVALDHEKLRDVQELVMIHVKRTNSQVWKGLAQNLSHWDFLWSAVPYKPTTPEQMPVSLSARRVKSLTANALGVAAAPAGELVENYLHAERSSLVEWYPELEGVGADMGDADADVMLMDSAFPRNWLSLDRKDGKKTPAATFAARGLSRIAARDGASRMHADIHLANALRSYQMITVQHCVAQGLLTLRNVNDLTDREAYENLLLQATPHAYRRYVMEKSRDEGDASSDEELAAAAQAAWVGLTMEHGDDPHKDLRERHMKEELGRVEKFLRADREKGWTRVADDEHDTMDAYLDAWDFLKHPPEETPRALRDVIDAERCRDELKSASRMFHPEAAAAKEWEIAARVFGAVLRFPHSHPGHDISTLDASGCTPNHVRDMKKINCFTGPWLAAAMLLECGFDEDRIFYCDVQGNSGGTQGTHGSLLLVLSSGQQLLLDIGFKKMRNIPLKAYPVVTRQKLQSMMDAEARSDIGPRFAPVRARLGPNTAKRLGIHPQMDVMPMRAGFTWGSLLTAGLDALEAGKIEDARHALELAHGLHPASPDILCGLARCCVAEGDTANAKLWLDEALRQCGEHLLSRYHRALVQVATEHYGAALLDLDYVLHAPYTWYGGRVHMDHASKLRKTLQELSRAEDHAFILDTKVKLLQDDGFEVESNQDSLSPQEAPHGQES